MEVLKTSLVPQKEIIKRALRVLKNQGAVVFPTDTVYGLLSDAANKRAVEKVFKIKKRKRTKPFPVFVKDIKTAKRLAVIDGRQEKILRKHWPGRFTFILKAKNNCKLAEQTIAKDNTIGIRAPDYRLVNILIKKFNKPLIGTSANISDKPCSTKIKEVIIQFISSKYQPDLIIDNGNLRYNKPSRVIDLTGKKEKVLRY
ncbi:MAG: L-threonylcarbamoyladenylate synthase [Candidatus Pacebacteria bacterium]|nr:L-threonylcarbamoyladenylate synthase [Candidatus Paceibacterota bacterium]